MNYFLVVLLFLTACGVPKPKTTDSDFIQYVERFEQETSVNVFVPIIYGGVKNDYAAVCEIYSDGYRLIRVNAYHWDRMQEFGKEELVYHELGHCVLNRDHVNDFTVVRPQGYSIPNSIMYPYTFGDSFFYYVYREHYVRELTNPGLRLGE